MQTYPKRVQVLLALIPMLLCLRSITIWVTARHRAFINTWGYHMCRLNVALLLTVFSLGYGNPALAGPNANATLSMDLVTGGGNGNQINDGVTSGFVSGKGTHFSIEIFAKDVVSTTVKKVTVYFKSDHTLLDINRDRPVSGGSFAEWSYNNPGETLKAGVTFRSAVKLNTSGFIMQINLITLADITNKECIISIERAYITDGNGIYDAFAVENKNISITLNPTSLPPNTPPNVPRKNMLPGDINGDGSVNVADFSILTDNFGRSDGDTFNPNDLVEASLLPTPSVTTVTVTITVRDTIPKTILSGPLTSLPKPGITIEPGGGWGYASMSNLQLVFESVRDVFCEPLMYPYDSDIDIEHNAIGPLVTFLRNRSGSHRVILDSKDNRWAQQIFQFAHEYGHILSNYRRDYDYDQQEWFDESIGAMASFYALRSLSQKWQTDPPNDHYGMRAYANNGLLRRYWQTIVANVPQFNRDQFREWYRQNRQQLESDAYLRDKNDIVAWNLLDIFENNPEAWNAIRYMNRGSIYKNEDFQSYLSDWYLRTPPLWQFVVAEIMDRFGISLLRKPAVPTDYPVASPKGLEQ